jgi:uncharacterized sulfatase
MSKCAAVAVLLAVVLLALGAAAADAASAPARPNILWISTEDISPDLGCYGDAYARTPHIDQFASQGVRFTRAFSSGPVCSVSRSSIITGMYASSIGTQHHRSKAVPPAFVKCFPEYLRAAGYFCTNNSKTDYNFNPPVTAWDENGDKAHWRHRAKDQPFFAVFNILTSHESRTMDPDAHPEVNAALRADERHDPAMAVLPPFYPDSPVIRQQWARYYDCITAMDKEFEARLKELLADGLSENTIVFFWGDHGRGLPRGKRWLWDSGIQVPLIVRWPGRIKPGSVRDDLVSLMDLGPTVLSIAGVKIPEYFQGQAFLGDAAGPRRKFIHATRDRMDETSDTMRAVRDERFKYIKNFHPELPYAQPIKYMDKMALMKDWRRLNAEGKLTGPPALFFRPTKPPEELYDTEADPFELTNLADASEHRAELKRFRAELKSWMERIHDPGPLPESELQERMRPGGKMATTEKPVIEQKPGDDASRVRVAIRCPTEGASIAYTIDTARPAAWKLYVQPLNVAAGTVLRSKACRIGYSDSPEVRIDANASSAK